MSGQGNGAGAEILRVLAENMATYMHRTDAIEKKLDALMKHLGMGANGQPARGGKGGGEIGDLDDIQGQYGDPKLGKMPKNWKLENCEGKRASQCSPEVLDAWADFLDWKADNPREGKEQYVKNDRRDARRCRRWAVEIREGRVKQDEPAAGGGYPSDWDDGPPPARPTPHSAGNAPPNDWGDNRTDW